MQATMPQVLNEYVRAVNERDEDAFAALFTDAAVVYDEGGEHRGVAQIRHWMHDTVTKYQFTLEPQGAAEQGAEKVVTMRVTGDFPGSPVTLRFHFTLDGERISALRIQG